ncbi:MAG: O-antigen ligase family protein [Bacteriovoracaceae bacterium]|nr:O-antigen ligase family protein [Bacteriovoracaceae bacterium]
MKELELFIIECHQFFFLLVVLVFSFLLLNDLSSFKNRFSSNKRSLIVLGLSVFCLGIIWVLFEAWGIQGLFFSIEFGILTTFAIIHPKYAVSFLVYLLLSRPWESYSNQMMSSMPRDISIITVATILFFKVVNKKLYFRFNPGTLTLILFSIWMFLSGFFSNHVDVAMFQFSEVFSKGVILFLLIQNGLENEEDIIPVKAVFVLAILEKCFVSFMKSYVLLDQTIPEDSISRLESVGILSNSNDIAAIFVLAIPFAIFFILRTKIRPFNWLVAIGALTVMSVLVWKSQSRGALLGLFAIFGAYALTRIRSKKLLALSFAFGAIATVGAFSMLQRGAEDIEGSTSNRKLYWQAGVNMAVRNPIFGVGFWGFPQNLPNYVPDGNVGSEGEHMTAHSTWVLALAEGGPIGLIIFLSLWGYAFKEAWKIRQDSPEYFLGLAGYGTCITFLSHTYLLYPYILLSLSITHAKLVRLKS